MDIFLNLIGLGLVSAGALVAFMLWFHQGFTRSTDHLVFLFPAVLFAAGVALVLAV